MPTRSSSCALALGAAFASLLLSAPAAATVDVPAEGVQRSVSNRSSSEYPLYINREDCLGSDEFSFSVRVSEADGANFEVWLGQGGASCLLSSERATTGVGCTQLDTFALPAEANFTVIIPSAKIAGSMSGVDSCIDNSTNTEPRGVTLYFMVLDGNEDVGEGSYNAWDLTAVDLLGPVAPTELSVGIGDEQLIVSFEPKADDGDRSGYYVYSERLDGGGGGGGSGGSGDGGMGGVGGSVAGECVGATLVPGEVPAPGSGKASADATEISAKGLENYVPYAVGVAAYDSVGNVGKLSSLVCATPLPVDDFYKNYRNAGGRAGGGYCSLSPGLRGDVLLFGGAAAALLGIALRRRARAHGGAR